MKQINFSLSLALIGALVFTGCTQKTETINITDKNATDEVRALYVNLKNLSGNKILYGQQDATAYGVDRNDPVKEFCDIKDVTGAYPAVYGFDIGHIEDSVNIDSVSFTKITRLIKEAYSRGGVITISWHEPFPGTNSIGVADSSKISRILPGGDLHMAWKKKIDLVGAFFKQLVDANNKPIPVLFRPYHEHNGDWFWWGTKANTPEEYISIFRYTQNYLRDSLNIHQLLYIISPDRSRMKTADADADFLYAYPGDEYVDIIGLDDYWDIGKSVFYNPTQTRREQDSLFISSLKAVVRIATEKGKIPILSESGLESLTEADWYTSRILNPIKSDSIAKKIAYILVWRNARQNHFYAPYPGHYSIPDFMKFYNDSTILFEDKLPPMYKISDSK